MSEYRLPTIKEIAKRLNVSVLMVSRALRDHPSIGLVTTMRVQNVAKEPPLLQHIIDSEMIAYTRPTGSINSSTFPVSTI